MHFIFPPVFKLITMLGENWVEALVWIWGAESTLLSVNVLLGITDSPVCNGSSFSSQTTVRFLPCSLSVSWHEAYLDGFARIFALLCYLGYSGFCICNIWNQSHCHVWECFASQEWLKLLLELWDTHTPTHRVMEPLIESSLHPPTLRVKLLFVSLLLMQSWNHDSNFLEPSESVFIACRVDAMCNLHWDH